MLLVLLIALFLSPPRINSSYPDKISELEVNDPQLGQYQVRLWHHLHFQQSPMHAMHLILVERIDEVQHMGMSLVS